jgi:hypothetical protein
MNAAAQSGSAGSEQTADEGGGALETAVYVYALVPADVEIDLKARGVGDPPSPVTLITHNDVAALASEIPVGTRLGTPEDFAAHARIVDGAAAEVPVLPLRFGAVVPDRDAVVDELLAPYSERLTETLRRLEDRVQFVIKGRYVQDAVLREVLDEDPQARQLHEHIANTPEEASRDDRVALGELISTDVEARRQTDTRRCAEFLDAHGVDFAVREPTHEFEAFHIACLITRAEEERLRHACARFARDSAGRIDMELLGPMAAYDFVDAEPLEGV